MSNQTHYENTFFLPFGGRTGSEISLMNLILNSDRKEFQMAVACRKEGALLKDTPPDLLTFVYEESQNKIHHRLYRKITRRAEKVMRIHEMYRPDVWYVNTIIQPDILRYAQSRNIPCIIHAHELDHMLAHLNEQAVQELIAYPKLIIAASKAVQSVFNILGRQDNIEVCYETVVIEKIKADCETSLEIRRSMGISPQTFVWSMSGTLDPNKSPSLFVDVAREILQSELDAHFLWLGKSVSGYSVYAREKANSYNLSEKITWCGDLTDDYYKYLNVANGFVLTSTQESFPLVMLEAAALGKPIVSFDSGGVREFIQPGMGVVVDSGNRSELVKAMMTIMKGNLFLDSNISRRQAEKYDAPTQAQNWQAILRKYCPPQVY